MVCLHIVEVIGKDWIEGTKDVDKQVGWDPCGLQGFKQVASILESHDPQVSISQCVNELDQSYIYKIFDEEKFLELCKDLSNQHLWPRLVELARDYWIEISW